MVAVSDAPTSLGATSMTTEDRQVGIDKVLVYSRRQCKYCFGTGLIVKLHRREDGQSVRNSDVCGCASSRFFKANPKVRQDPATGGWYWPEE